jgi:hypothetical protein
MANLAGQIVGPVAIAEEASLGQTYAGYAMFAPVLAGTIWTGKEIWQKGKQWHNTSLKETWNNTRNPIKFTKESVVDAWDKTKNTYKDTKALKESLGSWQDATNYRYYEGLAQRYAAPKVLAPAELANLSPAELVKYNQNVARGNINTQVRSLVDEGKTLLEKKGVAQQEYKIMKEMADEAAKNNRTLSSAEKTILDNAKQSAEASKTAFKANKQAVELAKAQAKLEWRNLKVNAYETGQGIELTKWQKRGMFVEKWTGVRGVKKLGLKAAANTGSIGKAVRFAGKNLKGGGLFAVLSLAMEAPELYNTFKRCGTGKGFAQLGKTVASTAVEVAAFTLGSAAGAALVGATIGSAIPIVGTILGAAVGLLCGWFAGKKMKEVCGPTELEKHENKEQIANAEKALETNPETIAEAAEIINKMDDNDPKKAKAVAAYNEFIAERNKFAQASSSADSPSSVYTAQTAQNSTTSASPALTPEQMNLIKGLKALENNNTAYSGNTFIPQFMPDMMPYQFNKFGAYTGIG